MAPWFRNAGARMGARECKCGSRAETIPSEILNQVGYWRRDDAHRRGPALEMMTKGRPRSNRAASQAIAPIRFVLMAGDRSISDGQMCSVEPELQRGFCPLHWLFGHRWCLAHSRIRRSRRLRNRHQAHCSCLVRAPCAYELSSSHETDLTSYTDQHFAHRPLVLLDFESRACNAALSNDRLQGSNPNLWVVWNGYRHCPKVASPLHDDVASTLPNDLKAMLFEIRHTSRPERTRSLPMCRFKSGNEHLRMKTTFDFG